MNGYASCRYCHCCCCCCCSHFLITVVTIWFKISDWCCWHVRMILMLSSNNFVFTSFNLSQWLICPQKRLPAFSQSKPRSNDFINLQSGWKGACNDEAEDVTLQSLNINISESLRFACQFNAEYTRWHAKPTCSDLFCLYWISWKTISEHISTKFIYIHHTQIHHFYSNPKWKWRSPTIITGCNEKRETGTDKLLEMLCAMECFWRC